MDTHIIWNSAHKMWKVYINKEIQCKQLVLCKL